MSEISEAPVETQAHVNPQGHISRREFLKLTAEKGKQLMAMSLLPAIPVGEPKPPIMQKAETPFLNENDRLMDELHGQTSPCVKAMQGVSKKIKETYNLTDQLPFGHADFLPYGLMKDYAYGESKNYPIVNRRDIYRWGKNGNITPPVDQIHRSAVYIGDEPDETANSLRQIATNLVDGAMLDETYRASHVIVDPGSADSSAWMHKGILRWGTELYVIGRGPNQYETPLYGKPDFNHLVHEVVHLGVPEIKLIPIKATYTERQVRPSVFASAPYQDIAKFYTDWYRVIGNNWHFFHTRFTGDNNTYFPHGSPDLFAEVIKKRGGKELFRMVDEMIAELGVDYVGRFGINEPIEGHLDHWPEEVTGMVSRTWNYVQNGSKSNNKPLNPEQKEKLDSAIFNATREHLLFLLAYITEEHKVEPSR